MNLQPLEPGPTHGRYSIGSHELTCGDLIEFADVLDLVQGRVEHDGKRYIVVTWDRWLSLNEILVARYLGRL